MTKQKTISSPVTVSGVGLHSGKKVTMTFHPAPVNSGRKFKRVDVEGQPVIEARLENVVDTSRGTSIGKNGVRISTVEHTLAALAGLSIDNILIELDNSETPILDGSSKYLVEALSRAGIVEQEAEKKVVNLKQNISLYDSERNVEMLAVPADRFRISVMIDYNLNVLGTQNACLDHIENFAREIAPSRTFVFLHELEYLLTHDLIKGGDLNNAIVFVNRLISPEELAHLAKIFNKPDVKVLKEGILNNLELYFPNEPARHKLLDIIGDLALLEVSLNAHIIAYRPGHYTNIEFAKKINETLQSDETAFRVFKYEANKKPLYDIIDIQKILPHRPPFLLIDKVLEMDEKRIVGIKNVTMNESYFIGHFPEEPVMPGVLQVESMAQCGGIFALSRYPDPQNYITYFLKIENARFKNKVVPGDTIVFVIDLISPVRRGLFHMKGTAYVGDKIVMEAELLAQVVKKNKA